MPHLGKVFQRAILRTNGLVPARRSQVEIETACKPLIQGPMARATAECRRRQFAGPSTKGPLQEEQLTLPPTQQDSQPCFMRSIRLGVQEQGW